MSPTASGGLARILGKPGQGDDGRIARREPTLPARTCLRGTVAGYGRLPVMLPRLRGDLVRIVLLFCVSSLLVLPVTAALAQETPVAVRSDAAADAAIEERLEAIFGEIDNLGNLTVSVSQGVVRLSGEVPGEPSAERALTIASRVEGVVTVEDEIERTLDIEGNVSPFVDDTRGFFRQIARSWPVYAIVFIVFCVILLAGLLLASWDRFWNRIAPSPFLASLLAQSVRILFFVFAVMAALAMLGATALVGALAGLAGIAGLALGFAVRDTIENYIASILLSVRQPFRARDQVVINDKEGIVVRLTSRATILMTLDGNHLRIPNADVFKGVILNYTRNPERRFEFILGVDAADDPVEAMEVGLKAIAELDFVLDDPAPQAFIQEVGASSINLFFGAWIDQTRTDFMKSRSLAIRAAKTVLEEKGFTLPEPIYRLRFDDPLPAASPTAQSAAPRRPRPGKRAWKTPATEELLDLAPDPYLQRKVAEERAETGNQDLLDSRKPVE